MTKKASADPSDFIVPLNINGLDGRMLYMPAPKAHQDRDILMIYGHHSSLERWWGLAQNFNKYGSVTMPDLPGFGGMDSLYSIGKTPTLDAMADYLASFVKWRYKRKKVVIIGLSYGFLVATRMLQRYPELSKKVEMLVSAVGFSHWEDFVFSPTRLFFYRHAAKLLSNRVMATMFRYTALTPWVLRSVYHKTYNAKKKFAGADPELHERMMDREIELWHGNDVRTHWYTTYSMLTVDNCIQRIELPVWHVSAALDQYFDAHRVEQHMRVIFSDYYEAQNKSVRHAPSVIADMKESASFIPAKLGRALLTGKKP